jgi:glycosyltransferase involved in cell wall biosynthesis
MQFFTVCARNYLAFATTLGQSILRHHPGAHFTVWMIDYDGLLPAPEGITVRPVVDALDPEEFAGLSLRYSILELATAIKPACMMRHFTDGAQRVIYLDPDIYVFRPIKEVFDALDEGAQGVLTPHTMQPLPKDGAHPDDLDLLRSGIYNLGFLALQAGTETNALLAWWWSWLRTHCFSDPATGVFTDQKWMNFAPLFWPELRILRHPGYNVAYWNLPQRNLEKAGEEWRVNGVPLVFFHFSGFDPARPALLSKHQTRIDVKPWSALADILNLYAAAVIGAGHEQTSRLSLPQHYFDNGVSFDDVCHRLYRNALSDGRNFAHPLKTGDGTFFAWVNETVPGDRGNERGRITRYVQMLYEMRPDVRRVFPDALGQDRSAFLSWVKKNAVKEMKADSCFIKEAGLGKMRQAEIPGVNFVGYLRAEMGVGEAARGYIRALQRQEIPLSCIDVSELSPHRSEDNSLGDIFQIEGNPAPYPVNIIHANADHLPVVQDFIGGAFFQGRYNIGIWAWETQHFPEMWRNRFDPLNEIWVGSSFMADAIAQASPIPVIHIPHIVEVPVLAPDRAAFGLAPDEFTFLFVFDFHSVVERKNPAGVIAAFRQAFQADEPVRLLVKSMHGASHQAALDTLRHHAGDARITFLDATLDSLERYRLLASCDAFVSLHRAEGFGLGIAEAMAIGKPVIATGWSGNMDFMKVSNSLPVGYSLQPLAMEQGPYAVGTLWAEPDLDHAARLMRRLWEEPELARTLGERARLDIQRDFSAGIVGDRMRERLRLIVERQLNKGGDRVIPIPSWWFRLTQRVSFRFWFIARNFSLAFIAMLPDRFQTVARRVLQKVKNKLRD